MRTLQENHYRIPYVIASKYAQPHTDLFEELVAEGNLWLVVSLRSYQEGHGTKLETWLYGQVSLYILRYQMALKGKGRSRIAQLLRMERVPERYPDKETSTEELEFGFSLLHRLEARDRQIFLWKHQENLSLREIGLRLGTSLDWGFRRLGKIRKILDGYLEECGC